MKLGSLQPKILDSCYVSLKILKPKKLGFLNAGEQFFDSQTEDHLVSGTLYQPERGTHTAQLRLCWGYIGNNGNSYCSIEVILGLYWE